MEEFLERGDDGLYFDPSTGKLTTRRDTLNSNSDDGLYFDPSTGKLTTRRDTLNSNSDDGLYFDPSTGKLTTRLDAKYIMVDMNKSHVKTVYFDPLSEKFYNSPEGELLDGVIPVEFRYNEGFFGAPSFSTAKAALERGLTSKGFAYAAEHLRPVVTGKSRLHEYYKIQSLQWLGERNSQVSVPVWIARGQSRSSEHLNVAPAWIEHIQQAIDDINYAAPGLRLYITSDASIHPTVISGKVRICGNSENSCYTRGNVLTDVFMTCDAEIYLHPLWRDKKRTSCHELLHALGFQHEHKRPDRDASVHVQDVEGEWEAQYCKSDDLLGITRFDPHSIMMYPEDQVLLRNSGDPVWVTKPTTGINREMSELDKVSLNNIYRPCKGPNYSPTRFGKGITGLWYCGRYFGVQTPDHDGYCGPTNGPNCPACRVLRSDRVVSLWKKGKWQGWTGEVYCGHYFGVKEQGHDGYCGPNNGPSCPKCYIELLSGN